MPLFDAATIERVYNRGEQEITQDRPIFVDRISLPITAGTDEITLPDYIIDVRKVMYKGTKLDPMGHQGYRKSFLPTGRSIPDAYIFNNITRGNLKLYPVPSENVAAGLGDLWAAGIEDCLTIEFYRSTDNNTYKLPAAFREFVLKYYMGYALNLLEGSKQNIGMSKYYESMWNFYLRFFEEWYSNAMFMRRNASWSNKYQNRRLLYEERLPYNFGISVDKGN